MTILALIAKVIGGQLRQEEGRSGRRGRFFLYKMAAEEQSLLQRAKFFIYAGGIFFLYFYYGVLQESM